MGVFSKTACRLFASLKLTNSYVMKVSTRKNSMWEADLKLTCLYDFHLEHGGKMVPFAGWSMPVQYPAGVNKEHLHTRAHASLFDVSHMCQFHITGRDRVKFMESLVVGDVSGLKDNQGILTLFTNEYGGILDDLIVTNTTEDYLYVVTNAACAENDEDLLLTSAEDFRDKGYDVNVHVKCDALLAVQGPEMASVLQPGVDVNLDQLSFMHTAVTTVFGVPNCRVSRCGYTGEDGVEISCEPDKTQQIAEQLLNSPHGKVQLAGLGARDSLRLEAGLCLYGSDIWENTTPVEAGLAWTIGKERREKKDFPGADKILKELKEKPLRKRVGFKSKGPPVRSGTLIYDETGSYHIGEVTSGCPSPSLKHNIAMGYLQSAHSKPGSRVRFEVRNKMVEGEVVKMPFVQCRYFVQKKAEKVLL